ncbi:MAG: cob(I)yrinic acid a,c-diamide adenosyltransferase [Candidatus Omnitrophica bacterium]|nr:cob(I)yrinic acid a,c-diamide adenosyltransferase [Candidatus Omnitrophota bacterium]MDD5352317.1 cob(I)yrinic acid a,c-diamide adenosyltransferase [Candidatus Omnitrophota bacterium]MDD5549915.1 cob(I)yrinic acid a,c-diamide adenosyltransferase [Candidatus Omnitrophota bacterium]
MLHIYYGKGKGKTSAALGLILRAAGYKKKIIFVQFLKPPKSLSGECISIRKFTNVKQIRFEQTHPVFLKKKTAVQIKKLKECIQESILTLKEIVQNKNFDILVCDEVLNLIDFIKESDLVKIFTKIKNKKEIILTGINKPKKLAKIADYITEFRLVKHPFQKGTIARKTIEY